MPRTPAENLIPRADKLLIRSFPKIAQRLSAEVDELDRAELDAWLKLLPGAIERFQAVAGPTNDLHESVEVAITQLVTSFGSRNASAVESTTELGTSNTPAETEETADSVSEPELPEGSDTSQQETVNSLPHNELQVSAGNTGESSDQQADGPNPRVRRKQRPRGRALYRQRLQELGEAGNNRG